MRYVVQTQARFTVGYKLPVLTVYIKTELGVAVDITGLTLALGVWADKALLAAPTVDFGSMTVTDGAAGKATYAWSDANITALVEKMYTCVVRLGTGASTYETTWPFLIVFQNANRLPFTTQGG